MELARIRSAQGRHAEAAEFLRQAVQEKESAMGPEALTLELSLLARALWRMGDHEAARHMIERAAPMLGQALLYRERTEEAASLLREKTEKDALAWEELAEAEAALGRGEASREAWSRAAERWREALPESHPLVQSCRRQASAR